MNATTSRPPRSKKPIDWSKGLHQLGPTFQLKFMEHHALELVNLINIMMEKTYSTYEPRSKSFELNRDNKKQPHHREAKLERAIAEQWHFGPVFLRDFCDRIVSYQLPLFKDKKKSGWGYVDLVGISPSGGPVVIELKDEDSNDTPLRMLIEATAYGLALRRAWNEPKNGHAGGLSDQWNKEFRPSQKEMGAPLLEVPLICAAPTNYWRRRIGSPGKHADGKVELGAWKALNSLVDAICTRGFPVRFVQFDVTNTQAGLLQISQPTSVQLPR